MMFVILVYDVGSKRVGKVMKTAKKYLNPVQKSVFEGFMTEGKIGKLKAEIMKIIDPEHDSVMLYKLGSMRFAEKEEIGIAKNEDLQFL